MKISTLFKSLGIVSISMIIVIASCKKDNSNNNNNNNNGGNNNSDDSSAIVFSGTSATADNAYNDVLQVVLEGSFDNNIAYKASSSEGTVETNGSHAATSVNGVSTFTCASYILSPADLTTFPKTLTVDFGNGCTSGDGITRKGKIVYVLSGKILTPGTTASATFQNYSVNGYQLEGTYSITNTSTIAGISFVTSVTGGKITFPDASFYNYAGNKTIKMTAGMTTPSDLSDDVYSIAGSNTFSSSAGNTLSDSITTLLTKAYACKFVSAGVISFIYNNNISGTLDFGSGTCDSTVTIKVGPTSKDIILY